MRLFVLSEALMSKVYKVNELFYSIQAEGRYAGTPAVFVRLAGCNLDCPFCDTNHAPFVEMSKEDIEQKVAELDPTGEAIVVFTGGEPTLQLADDEIICPNRVRTIETNGIITAPSWIHHVTISPKIKLPQDKLATANELKFLYGWFEDDYLSEVEQFARKMNIECYIQPLAKDDNSFDAIPAVEFAKQHPYWRLSLQFHKLINIQ